MQDAVGMRTPWVSQWRCYASLVAVLWPLLCCRVARTAHFFEGYTGRHDPKLEARYGIFPEELRKEMAQEARIMFYHGYDNYMRHAFPMDELNPIYCSGRGPDYDDPENVNINDVLGDYSLTLVETLDTLAVLGNASEFQRAVQLVVESVSFDKPNKVQVFEVNIRLLGALLSAHLLMEDREEPFGPLRPPWYEGQLLEMAHNLGSRLLPAFEGSPTGIPLPRVNLKDGIPLDGLTHTCTAGAGSLLLEFGVLSRLLGDPTYEGYARRASDALWKLRSKVTGLFGNVIDSQTGRWIGRMSGLGAGLDSYFEYLLKSYILFGEEEDWRRFNQSYASIKQFLRRGRPKCNEGVGDHPLYVNVEMNTGVTHTPWIDALQVSFPAVQVLIGDIEEAICAHALYYFIWKRFGVFPERFNWQRTAPEVNFYPLRPELIEATYFLYQATRSDFYLHVGREILNSLNNYTKAECGYATVHNVLDMSLEDRMESFFLSETCKYLYLLFDKDNHLNKHFHKYLFSTEGHIFPLGGTFRTRPWEFQPDPDPEDGPKNDHIQSYCESLEEQRSYFLPLKSQYLEQVRAALGVTN